MPYAIPSPPSSSSSLAPSSSSARPTHRRTRSSFTDERGPGAFVSLGSLPRRHSPKRALFHLNVDEDSPPEHDTPLPPPEAPNGNGSLYRVSSLKNSRENGRFSPSIPPPNHIDLSQFDASSDSVPFPTQSPPHSPSSQQPPSPFASRGSSSSSSSSSLPRTPSTPIILSSGKPLKSSLKSSSSSPSVAGDFAHRTKHLRAQSAPSTPSAHKNVHFAGEDDNDSSLVSVRVFNRSGKPASLSKPPGDDTETETEAENGPSSAPSSYPFPSFADSSPLSQSILHEINQSPAATSPVPQPNPSLSDNVFLETITLPRTRPPTLRGTVLVRNLAFEKTVAVRFTLDDWVTTSEVLCKHVVSLPGLPPPFPKEKKPDVDNASKIVNDVVDEEEEPKRPAWDRFSFTIRLEDYELKLSERTLWLVVRYYVPSSYVGPGGEWWDNNEAKNYRVGFRRASISPLTTTTSNIPASLTMPNVVSIAGSMGIGKPGRGTASGVPGRMMGAREDIQGFAQQRTFSAPGSLRYTPMTGTLAGVPILTVPSPPSTSAPAPAPPVTTVATAEGAPSLVRSMSSPYPPSSPPQAVGGYGSAMAPNSDKGMMPSPTSPIAAERASSYIRRRLSLSNYVAPTSPTSPHVCTSTSTTTTESVEGDEKAKEGGETGKDMGDSSLVTPPTTPPGSTKARSTSLPEVSTALIPKTAPVDIPTHTSFPSTTTTTTTTTTIIGGMPATVPIQWPTSTADFPPELETPFSPTSTSSPDFGSFGAGLMSPPRSRENSEDGSGEGGRSSPQPQSQTQSEGQQPGLGLTLSAGQDEGMVYPGSSAMGGMNDSSYAAFVRQWCFAQSTPPTPGVHSHSPSSGSPPSSSSPTPSVGSPRHDAREGDSRGNAVGWVRSSSPSAVERNHAVTTYNGNGRRGGGPMFWEGMNAPGSGSNASLPGVGNINMGAGYGFPGFPFGVPGVGGRNGRGHQADVGMVGGEC
ncbi:unnamed protein product [Somion occarium]|uniref:CBM21 domain-containing protein n=1 Tax=Somion occarium TaxID=3059160 RepID=A0ABP1CJD5_9APHY